MMSMTIERLSSYQQPTSTVSSDNSRAESRLCGRDAASPAQMLPPAPAPSTSSSVKNERSSPQDSTISRSRSASPSGSSYPSTTPERVSPLAPPSQIGPHRTCSDIMRTLAARHNNGSIDYLNRFNGCVLERPQSAKLEISSIPLGGIFLKWALRQSGTPYMPAFPNTYDMSATKALLQVARRSNGGRSRRKRVNYHLSEHSPLDLSTAGYIAGKRARPSSSQSEKSDGDYRLNGEPSEPHECPCVETRIRVLAMTVGDVCNFVKSIDICAEYSSNFHEQRIDGSGLPLLTEEHLTGMLKMKLGPALKLKSLVANMVGPCVACQASGSANAVRINGAGFKPEPRSNTTSPS